MQPAAAYPAQRITYRYHPYGYLQVESIFVIIKGVMMLSVTFGVSAEVLDAALSGGNPVNNAQVAAFQCCLGVASTVIFLIMKRLNRNLSSPTIEAELLGWRMDILYSLGMAAAFFLSRYLDETPLAAAAPYFDQIVAVLVMVFMLPENIRVLWRSVKDVFLFAPDPGLTEEIKEICYPVMEQYRFSPVFFDITKTGRHLWVAVYFRIAADSLAVNELADALQAVNAEMEASFPSCTCELILVP